MYAYTHIMLNVLYISLFDQENKSIITVQYEFTASFIQCFKYYLSRWLYDRTMNS